MSNYPREKENEKEKEDLTTDDNLVPHGALDPKDLYDEKYYHGHAYENYTFDTLRANFLQKIRDVEKFCGKKGRLLDIGCALGFFVKVSLEQGFDAYGVDFSEYAVKEGRKILGDRIRWADVERGIPFEEGFFDVVTAWDVLEHLKHPERFLKECRRALKIEGFLFATTLNYNSLMSKLMKERWRFIDPRYHLTHMITPNEVKNWLAQAGLEEICLKSFGLTTKNLTSYFTSTTPRRIVNIIEKSLNLEIELVFQILKPLYPGDSLSIVARRVV